MFGLCAVESERACVAVLVLMRRVQLAKKNGGVGKPEMRIPSLILCSFFVPIGLLCVPLHNRAVSGR